MPEERYLTSGTFLKTMRGRLKIGVERRARGGRDRSAARGTTGDELAGFESF
jgi:hypothetical protein